MKRLLRLAWRLNTALMVISLLSMCGMVFEIAFMVDFVVENRTADTVWITPIGARGAEGDRGPLPITLMGPPLHLPAFRYGDFRLLPGEAVTIHYDYDDVNLSEIVIRDTRGRWSQLVVDPHPTVNQYHPPRQREFIITDLSRLSEAAEEPREAVAKVHARSSRSKFIYFALFGPWILWGAVELATHRKER